MLEALPGLLGGALGGALRFAPEILKFLDRKNERTHELQMFDKQLAADKLKGDQALAIARTEAESAMATTELNAMIAAITAQGRATGIAWVDAVNSLVRPMLTFYWCIGIYSFVLWGRWRLLQAAGVDPLDAVVQLFGAFEQGLIGSIFSFWFVDRSLRRGASLGR